MPVAVDSGYRQQNSIVLVGQPLPKVGRFDLKFDISTVVNVSPEEALRKVNRFVHRKISYLMRGENPDFLVAERVYWRVPVFLTFPSHGSSGEVGSIDVETGELNFVDQSLEEIQQRVHDLAARFAPETAPAG
jgi:hypothetical protein